MVVQEHSTATNMKRASHFTPRCNQMQLVLSMRREAKNDEARMTNAEGIPNDEIRNSDDEACLFGIPASSLIRHSSFEFCHFHFISSPSFLLHDNDLARRFFLRQGLWTDALRTPPGQECSNGSLTFFAGVRRRTCFGLQFSNVNASTFPPAAHMSRP